MARGALKTETLVRHMLQNPAAVERFLKMASPSQLEVWFPALEVTVKRKMKKVKNLLNQDGPWIEIPVDTPLHMDPSSETYHSM